MNIGCTRKLLEKLKLKPSECLVENPFFSWHANFFTLNRRHVVLLANDLTRYCVLLLGLKEQDFDKLGQLAISAIRESFQAEGIAPEIIDQYINALGEVTFTSTTDRSTLGVMNRFAKEAKSYRKFDLDQLSQVEFNLQMGNWDVNNIAGKYQCPQEVLYRELAKLANVQSPVRVRAFQFSIRFALNEYEVSRRLIVPGNITFRKLHSMIQAVIGWKDKHFYCFTIFNDGQPVAILAANQEILQQKTEVPVFLDRRTMLGDYLPGHNQIKYSYDFGVPWEHYLELEKTIEAYPHNYPACLEGKGNCPPEDVGGAAGYTAFLQALNDPEHPQHEETLIWGKRQGYQDFNLKWINHSLRYSQYLTIRKPARGPSLTWVSQ